MLAVGEFFFLLKLIQNINKPEPRVFAIDKCSLVILGSFGRDRRAENASSGSFRVAEFSYLLRYLVDYLVKKPLDIVRTLAI